MSYYMYINYIGTIIDAIGDVSKITGDVTDAVD